MAGKVIFNGELYDHPPAELLELLDSNYIYQNIHVRGYSPLHAKEHIDIADAAIRDIHGYGTGITAAELTEQVSALLRANRYPGDAGAVILRVFPGLPGGPGLPGTTNSPGTPERAELAGRAGVPGGSGRADTLERAGVPGASGGHSRANTPEEPGTPGNQSRTSIPGGHTWDLGDRSRADTSGNSGRRGAPAVLLECRSQLIYPRYTLWHKRMTAVVIPCEYIFMGHQTAVSRITSSYADSYAARNGADTAIVENCTSVLTNAGDEPLFMVKGREILTSPREEGAVESVMRRLVLRAAEKEGIDVREEPLRKEWLEQCDELFFPTVQGITSIRGFGSRSYYNLVAGRIAETIEKISSAGA